MLRSVSEVPAQIELDSESRMSCWIDQSKQTPRPPQIWVASRMNSIKLSVTYSFVTATSPRYLPISPFAAVSCPQTRQFISIGLMSS